MIFRVLADLVLVFHLAFVLFVVLGGLLVLRRPRLAVLHLPVAVWGVLIELTGGVCPLTPLENDLRSRGGEAGYAGDFIDHYVTALIYPAGLSRGIQYALAALVLVVNAAVYTRLVRARRKREPTT